LDNRKKKNPHGLSPLADDETGRGIAGHWRRAKGKRKATTKKRKGEGESKKYELGGTIARHFRHSSQTKVKKKSEKL